MINSIKFLVLAISGATMLSGCGESIPDCGDAKVHELIKQTFIKKTADISVETKVGLAAEMAKINLTVDLSMIPSGIVLSESMSEKKDKNSGKNYCNAKFEGNLIVTTTLQLPTIGQGVDMTPFYQPMAQQFGALTMVNDKAVFTMTKKLPEKISYRAYKNDKGELLVEMGN